MLDEGTHQVTTGQRLCLPLQPGDQGQLVISVVMNLVVELMLRLGQEKFVAALALEKGRDVKLLGGVEA